MTRSRVSTSATVPELPAGTPIWIATGDPDDHYRLCALIALHARSQCSGEAVETCLNPKSAWRDRLGAFKDVVAKYLPREHRGCLFDIDALHPGLETPETLWDDRQFVKQRRDFLNAFLEAVNEGGWVLVRPRPLSEISTDLDAELDDGARDAAAPDSALEKLNALLSVEGRPLLTWLVRSKHISQKQAERLAEDSGISFEDQLRDMVYEVISPSARTTAKRLSALRVPQSINGTLGPYLVEARPPSGSVGEQSASAPLDALRVPRADVDDLRASGIILQFSPTQVRIARGARGDLMARARRSDPEEWRKINQRLVASSKGSADIEEAETHHHAIEAGDVAEAIASARHYAADLRELAYRLSTEEKRYVEAARIYRFIVDNDDQDAYAWEYLGFNLARALGDDEPNAVQEHEILAAYKRAFELDRKNPLYEGRLLGFRARLGENIEREFDRRMAFYVEQFKGTQAVSFYAEHVFKGMEAGRWGHRRLDVIKRWSSVLGQYQRLRPLLWSGRL